MVLSGIIKVDEHGSANAAKLAALKSLESAPKGKINKKGVIRQFPFFAPDQENMKAAPKATEADKKYLEIYTKMKAHRYFINVGVPDDQ